jgi:hypothetical protein
VQAAIISNSPFTVNYALLPIRYLQFRIVIFNDLTIFAALWKTQGKKLQ